MSEDLNLIVSLDALLQERSVTRAAQRLHVSQPTMSATLAKLRRHYRDELLIRVGNTYHLTPLAERLVERTGHALAASDRVLRIRPDFDPATANHQFTLVASDCHLPQFGRMLVDRVADIAPGVRLSFEHSTAQVVHSADEYLRTVDGLLHPGGRLSDIPSIALYRDRYVCVVSPETVTDAPSSATLTSRPWVVAYQHPLAELSPTPALLATGEGIAVAATTEDFLAVPYLVTGTDRVGIMPERVARLHPASIAITVLDPPFDLGEIVESFWWHPVHNRDPAHLWLRGVMAHIGSEIDVS